MEEQLISILLPTYNSEKYLETAINSLIKQSYKNYELIVIDNNSQDNTLRIIKKYNNKIKIKIFNYPASNLSKALNFGITKCKGDFIARFDSDDLIRKNRLTKQVNFLKNNKDYVFVGTQAFRFGKHYKLIRPFPIYFDNDFLKLNCFFQSSFIHPTIMFNRKILLNKLDYIYDESLNECEDYDLWTRLIEESNFKNLRYAGIYYRVHEKSASNINEKDLSLYSRQINLNLFSKYQISLTSEELHIHRKISELVIYSNDNFDELNSNYINILNKIETNKILQIKYNIKKLKKFISKKYYRFCLRSVLTKNYKFYKCFNKKISMDFKLILVLFFLTLFKIRL